MTHPLTRLQTELEEHIENEAEKWDQLLAQQEAHTRAIADLTIAINELRDSTRDLVTTWRVLNALRNFLQWLSGFAIIGGVITWGLKKYGG